MTGKWEVSWQYIGDKKMYQVYRLRDINAVHHSGNRECYGEMTADREAAQSLADKLNEAEERGDNNE